MMLDISFRCQDQQNYFLEWIKNRNTVRFSAFLGSLNIKQSSRSSPPIFDSLWSQRVHYT